MLKRQSSWANADTLVEFVLLLSKVLEPLAQHRHVALTLDVCPVSERVVRACVRGSIFLHVCRRTCVECACANMALRIGFEATRAL